MVRLHATLFGVAAAIVIHSNDDHKVDDDDQIYANLSSVASTEVVQILEAFTNILFDPAGDGADNVAQAVQTVSGRMDLKAASQIINEESMPKDVTHLVQTVSDGDAVSQFDDASLAKARSALNGLVEKAWAELDNKIFKCKGFEAMNRQNHGQVTRDISRLSAQIADLGRLESESIEGISGKENEIKDQEALIASETTQYNRNMAELQAELTIRKNDLDVFQFILVFTKCKDATPDLAQVKAQVCETQSGRKTIVFNDQKIAAKYKKMLTQNTKKSIDMILRSVEAEKSSLLQQTPSNATSPPPKGSEAVLGEDARPCETASKGGEDECMKSCGPDPPDCALLHDKLSLMWGDYKDKVDEMTMDIARVEMDFEEIMVNLNDQLRGLATAKGKFNQVLSETRGNLNDDRQEIKQKQFQERKLNHQYGLEMTKCKKRIQWIMYQDMCAIKVVRNAVMENATTCSTDQIKDCDLDNWIEGVCTKKCDDTCSPDEPFKCGGWKKMTRNVVAQPNECGIQCPLLVKEMRCGQFKCAIDCQMSTWSSWSKCSAECNGGLQGHTRAIRTKPMNGGLQCNTVEETRACNSGACDRDCTLTRWKSWSPCSVACGGGLQNRVRHVLIPTRDQGKCPKATSPKRFRKRECNKQDCNGDEICIAKQDLVIGVDGSGSIRKSGFEVLKKYTKTLLSRYSASYYGESAMRVGLMLFGNGVIMPDGTVSPALVKQPLTSDIDLVGAAVEALPFKKGFTNMAQAFGMAEEMFIRKSRAEAHQAVLLITDGKPSFKWMTNEKVEQLDDKGIMRFFVLVNDNTMSSAANRQMAKWASQPWETNVVHVPGLSLLEAEPDDWAVKALTKFCPQAHSPKAELYQEDLYGYQHVKDSGFCGGQGRVLSKTVTDAASCAALAQGANAESFLLGFYFRRNWCRAGKMLVDEAQYSEWQKNKVDPDCKTGWKKSNAYDFYAMKPMSKGDGWAA